jgi:hypothetical protein
MPVGRVDEVAHRHGEHFGDLVGMPDGDRCRLTPPCDDRGHGIRADRDVERGQHPDHLDSGRVEGDLLGGLAQRRGDRVVVLRVQATPGEGDLPRVRAQRMGPLQQQQ